MNAYDIIIPVYNGYDVLTDCLESVRRHTSSQHRIVVIDDASPDDRVWPLLQRYEQAPGFLLLRNPENLGFVGTVNRGMALAPDRHVILLNSDTIVTAGWAEKMDACARSRSQVASVTALSNNATICSVPEWLVDNPLPQGHDVDSFAALVEAASFRQYPEIPTGVGFCMLIRREALEALGLFDAEAFGRGYGEENDWSMRALDAGWHHLCDDATYIFHQGSVSFGTLKDDHVTINNPVLLQRHPSYQDIIDDFMTANPLALIQQNLKLALSHTGERPVLLFVLHNPIDGDFLGGTEFHVKNLVDGLQDRYRTYVAYARESFLHVDHFVDGKKQGFVFPTEGDYRRTFERVIELFDVSLIHVHHFLGHDHRALLNTLSSFQGPTLLSVHDYYTACRNFNLLYKHQFYCKLPSNDFTCSGCIRATQDWTIEQLREYRQDFQSGLAVFDRLVFPSLSIRDDILAYHHLDADKAEIVEHGIHLPSFPDGRQQWHGRTPLRVAFIGTLVNIKGSETLRRLIAENQYPDIEWHFWGIPAPDFRPPLNGRLVYHGVYDREDIACMLRTHQIQVGLLPSVCPETYSFALSEFYAAGIPVVGSKLGAIGERITRDGTGWTVDPTDVGAILSLLGNLQRSPEALQDVCRRADFSVPSIADMCERYSEIYHQLLQAPTYERSPVS